MSTVALTTKAFPKNRTKSPTELIAATRRAFDDNILKAFSPDLQNPFPCIAEIIMNLVRQKIQLNKFNEM